MVSKSRSEKLLELFEEAEDKEDSEAGEGDEGEDEEDDEDEEGGDDETCESFKKKLHEGLKKCHEDVDAALATDNGKPDPADETSKVALTEAKKCLREARGHVKKAKFKFSKK